MGLLEIKQTLLPSCKKRNKIIRFGLHLKQYILLRLKKGFENLSCTLLNFPPFKYFGNINKSLKFPKN